MGTFDGKVALVTGAGSGMGAATARRLGAEGALVAIVDLDPVAGQETASMITGDGGHAIVIEADISREADNTRMFVEAQAAFGAGVDTAFLNAAILQPYIPFEEVTLDLWDKIMNINLRGTFMGVQAALRHLQPRGACVANASTAGQTGFSSAAAYATSKHGVIGLVRSAAKAFADRGLRINAVLPGLIKTPMNGFEKHQPIYSEDEIPDPPHRGPLETQHVADAVMFLMSRHAAGINGGILNVDAASTSAFDEGWNTN